MAKIERYQKRFGVHIVGRDKVFVASTQPLMGFREVEANSIANFLTRNLDKMAVKIELESRKVYPSTLTNLVVKTLDLDSNDIFIDKGDV